MTDEATTQDLVFALARTCARGDRQLSLVNELLAAEMVEVRFVPIPGMYRSSAAFVGASGLPFQSWLGLKKRLVTAGFSIVRPTRGLELRTTRIGISHPALKRGE